MIWKAYYGPCEKCGGLRESWRDYVKSIVRCKECGRENVYMFEYGSKKK